MDQALKKTLPAARILGIGIAVVAAAFILNNHYPSWFELAELRTFDLRMYARGTRKPRGEVAIVAIDDKSIAELGRWPWPRSVLARLTDALRFYKAGVIGFDMVFSEPDLEREKTPAALKKPAEPAGGLAPGWGLTNDQALANAIKAHGSTFLSYPLQILDDGDGVGITPGFVTNMENPAPAAFSFVQIPDGMLRPPILDAIAHLPNLPVINSAARGAGYFDVATDTDAILRSEIMAIRFHQRYCEPFILAIISAYEDGAPTTLTLADFGVERVAIGPVNIPVDEQGRMLVNFRGPAHTFPYYSVSDVLAHRVPPKALANKIVLVGTSALGVGDRWSTPMGAGFPGVEIHANAIDNILTGDFIQRSQVTAGMERAAAVVMGLLVSVAVACLSPSWSAVAVVALILGYFGVAQYLLAGGLLVGVLFPIVTTFITYALLVNYRYLTEGRPKLLSAKRFANTEP
jgi:adenylate cyclase